MYSYKLTQTHGPQDQLQLTQHSEKVKCFLILDLKEARKGEDLRTVGRKF